MKRQVIVVRKRKISEKSGLAILSDEKGEACQNVVFVNAQNKASVLRKNRRATNSGIFCVHVLLMYPLELQWATQRDCSQAVTFPNSQLLTRALDDRECWPFLHSNAPCSKPARLVEKSTNFSLASVSVPPPPPRSSRSCRRTSGTRARPPGPARQPSLRCLIRGRLAPPTRPSGP